MRAVQDWRTFAGDTEWRNGAGAACAAMCMGTPRVQMDVNEGSKRDRAAPNRIKRRARLGAWWRRKGMLGRSWTASSNPKIRRSDRLARQRCRWDSWRSRWSRHRPKLGRFRHTWSSGACWAASSWLNQKRSVAEAHWLIAGLSLLGRSLGRWRDWGAITYRAGPVVGA